MQAFKSVQIVRKDQLGDRCTFFVHQNRIVLMAAPADSEVC
jgi:hypothetical protein